MTFQRIGGALRILRLAYVLSGVAITILILYPWLEVSACLRFRGGQRLISRTFHRIMAALLGLRISIKGTPTSTRPLIVVANHISWLDIIAISSLLPAIFVTQHGVANWPIFGRLAKLSPSIFVNRDRRLEVAETINCISDALTDGEVVVIFPEGTSSDGTNILPFRSALLGAVRETLRKAEYLHSIFIQPVSVAYVGPKRRLAAWAREDEIEFVPHLLQVAGLGQIDIALTWEDPISANVSSDRKALSKQLEQTVRRSVAEVQGQAGSAFSGPQDSHRLSACCYGSAGLPTALENSIVASLPERDVLTWRAAASDRAPRLRSHRPQISLWVL
jgi:lyso-ornithine lipid O-acyltransferase